MNAAQAAALMKFLAENMDYQKYDEQTGTLMYQRSFDKARSLLLVYIGDECSYRLTNANNDPPPVERMFTSLKEIMTIHHNLCNLEDEQRFSDQPENQPEKEEQNTPQTDIADELLS